MKRIWITAVMCLAAATVVIAGGAGEPGKPAPAKLTVALNFPATDVTFTNIQGLAAAYVGANPGTPGPNHSRG